VIVHVVSIQVLSDAALKVELQMVVRASLSSVKSQCLCVL